MCSSDSKQSADERQRGGQVPPPGEVQFDYNISLTSAASGDAAYKPKLHGLRRSGLQAWDRDGLSSSAAMRSHSRFPIPGSLAYRVLEPIP